MNIDVPMCNDTMQIVCFSNLQFHVLVSVLASGEVLFSVVCTHWAARETISYLLSPYIPF
jgi:hypothetical protein